MREKLPNPMQDPARLTARLQMILWISLGLSFLSGVLVWWGESFRDPFSETPPPSWYSWRFWLVVHGALNPLLCLGLGYLLCRHVAPGWALRANRWSGTVLLILWTGLMVSGAGLYYGGDESWRSSWKGAHLGCGLALPVVLLWHGLGARRHARGN